MLLIRIVLFLFLAVKNLFFLLLKIDFFHIIHSDYDPLPPTPVNSSQIPVSSFNFFLENRHLKNINKIG